jgi:hypothetical protein
MCHNSLVILDNGLVRFSELLKDTEILEDLFVSEMQKFLLDPLEEFVNEDLKQLRVRVNSKCKLTVWLGTK